MPICDEPATLDLDLGSDWRRSAACVANVGQVNFFPERGESAREAKTICTGCPVREPCLEFAFRVNVSSGVWGGLTGRERRQLRRQRRTQAMRPQLTPSP